MKSALTGIKGFSSPSVDLGRRAAVVHAGGDPGCTSRSLPAHRPRAAAAAAGAAAHMQRAAPAEQRANSSFIGVFSCDRVAVVDSSMVCCGGAPVTSSSPSPAAAETPSRSRRRSSDCRTQMPRKKRLSHWIDP